MAIGEGRWLQSQQRAARTPQEAFGGPQENKMSQMICQANVLFWVSIIHTNFNKHKYYVKQRVSWFYIGNKIQFTRYSSESAFKIFYTTIMQSHTKVKTDSHGFVQFTKDIQTLIQIASHVFTWIQTKFEELEDVFNRNDDILHWHCTISRYIYVLFQVYLSIHKYHGQWKDRGKMQILFLVNAHCSLTFLISREGYSHWQWALLIICNMFAPSSNLAVLVLGLGATRDQLIKEERAPGSMPQH